MNTITKCETIEKTDLQVAPVTVKAIDNDGNVNLKALSRDEVDRLTKISQSLVVKDINSISNFGSELQSITDKSSNDFLSIVRSPQANEMGELITNLLSELEYVDIDDLKTPSTLKRFISRVPIISKFIKSIDKILTKYDSVASNIDTISKKITATKLSSLRDNTTLQLMFDNNVKYIKHLEDLILAGKIKLDEVNATLSSMIEHQNEYEPHQIQDLQEFANNLEKRVNELQTLRIVIKQSLSQIRVVQYNNIAVANKAQTIIDTTIPLWKNQLSIAVALYRQKQNIEAHKKVVDTTNTIILKNAELLKQNSVNVAKENERNVINLETLRESTRQLIDTIKEVKKIHEEAATNRKNTESELLKIEDELTNAMTASYTNVSNYVVHVK